MALGIFSRGDKNTYCKKKIRDVVPSSVEDFPLRMCLKCWSGTPEKHGYPGGPCHICQLLAYILDTLEGKNATRCLHLGN